VADGAACLTNSPSHRKGGNSVLNWREQGESLIQLQYGAFSEFWVVSRQTAPYSPELEPDIVLTQPHASGVDEICIPFGDRRRWQHNFALGGSITLHWVAELIAFSNLSTNVRDFSAMTLQ
jgi:hypothetical protein